MPLRQLSAPLVLLLCACSFDSTGLDTEGPPPVGTTTGEPDPTGTTTGTTTPPDPPEPTTTTEGSMSMSEGVVCGDGTVEGGEECDNGPGNADGAACKSDCTLNICGDGDIGPGEGCDDGNQQGGDGCSAACASESCGDGDVQEGEQCDDGNDVDNDGCTNTCTTPSCGDSIVQEGEQCDAGGENGPGKACKGDCTDNVCGDGDIGPGETCDDGNMSDGDGCTSSCTPEMCGDGMKQGAEECDDGNQENTDECVEGCKLATCGDGFIRAGVEDCEDGNPVDTDACSNECEENEPRRVFVSSQRYKPDDINGVSGADSRCQELADGAQLGGTWMAWISGSNDDSAPAARFARYSIPYERTDGTQVAMSWDDLTDGTIAAPINRTESGAMANGDPDVWSNTRADGTRRGNGHCDNWSDNDAGSSHLGKWTSTDDDWSDDFNGGCDYENAIYCFEQ